MRELLAHPGINLNYQSRQGESALFEAVSYKRGDVVEMLVTHPSCQVCLSSCQVLLSAVTNPSCQVDIVDQHDRTPFLVACQYGWVEEY